MIKSLLKKMEKIADRRVISSIGASIENKKRVSYLNKRVFAVGTTLAVMSLITIAILSVTVNAAGQVIIAESHSSYISSNGILHVVGEVNNNLDSAVKNVQITATFFDSTNNIIATVATQSMLNIILPGEKSPFEILLSDQSTVNKVNSYDLVVSSYSKPIDILPQNLRIISNNSYISKSEYYNIHGKILNEGPSRCTYTMIAATCYDTNGKVVGTTQGFTDPATIISGREAQFNIIIRDSEQSKKVSSYALQVQSNEAVMIPEFPLVVIPLFTAILASITILQRKTVVIPVMHAIRAVNLTST
jgi:hypothetical protein